MKPLPQRSSGRALARVDHWLNRLYGSRYNPIYQSGAIAVTLLFILLATGLYLLLFYRLGQPYASVARITNQTFTGRWIRGLHRFASDAAVVAILLHAFRMYAQRRDWGARALAWLSGLVLLFVVFVCGWTGYVMVWDNHAQLIAAEGARFLDALPIFSEPISRTFVGERPMPNAFFFLNLFAHVALPIGLGLLVWIHVSRVARPGFLPPRNVQITVTLALLLLAVLWPLRNAPSADLLRIPDEVPLDAFFTFWLPLTRNVSDAVVWPVLLSLSAVLLLVPWWGRPRKNVQPAKSAVNERVCTGCEQCMLDCPYGAIAMFPRVDGRDGIVARVDPDLCVACGICVGSCAPMALGPANETGRDQLAAARAWLGTRTAGAADVVVIGCAWSAAAPHADVFEVGCAGNLHTSTIEFLVRSRVGGVLIVTCPARDCRGREGPKWLHERVYHEREAELKARVDRKRIRIVEIAAADRAGYERELAAFRRDIAAMRPPEETDALNLVALCERSSEEVVA